MQNLNLTVPFALPSPWLDILLKTQLLHIEKETQTPAVCSFCDFDTVELNRPSV